MNSLVLALVSGSLLLAACDSAESRRIAEVRGKMVGSWLVEATSPESKSRRLMVLGADGTFTDEVQVTRADGLSERVEYGGEWSYDGTNFKRRFLRENGRQFGGSRIRYATFPLLSVSSSELLATDTVAGGQVTFRRVPGNGAP